MSSSAAADVTSQDTHRDRLFIAGRWASPRTSDVIAVENPATQTVLGEVPRGGPADVAAAVAAARGAAPAWRRLTGRQRGELLNALAALLEQRRIEVARTISLEMGAPVTFSDAVQVAAPITHLRVAAELAADERAPDQFGASAVVHEPVGVVAALTPWNYPLHLIVAKVAYALAAGCTVVLKPSELAPLNAFALADLVAQVGFPPGVFNLVSGDAVAGTALVTSPGVDLVSFTGSVPVGRAVAEAAARNLTRTVLELGGKSATILLDDADLEAGVAASVRAIAANSGQSCNAQSRLIVPRGQVDRVAEIARATAEQIVIGDPLDPTTQMGPVISDRQRTSIRAHIDRAIAAGARVIAGGPAAPAGLATGYYVQPTVVTETTPDMDLVQEEVFGPVLAVQASVNEADAVRLANATAFGLSGGVWSSDPVRAARVAAELDTGMVHLNGAPGNPRTPFGGRKNSGYGTEFGRYGLDEYLQLKAIHGIQRKDEGNG